MNICNLREFNLGNPEHQNSVDHEDFIEGTRLLSRLCNRKLIMTLTKT